MIRYLILIALVCTCCSGCANLWNRLFTDEEKKIEIKEEEKKVQEDLIGTMEGDEATDEDIEIEKAVLGKIDSELEVLLEKHEETRGHATEEQQRNQMILASILNGGLMLVSGLFGKAT